MTLRLRAALAGALLFASASGAEAVVDLGSVGLGTVGDLISFTDAYDDQVTFTTLVDGTVELAVFGASDTILAVAGVFAGPDGDIADVGLGNVIGAVGDPDLGTSAILALGFLIAGTYSYDITASTLNVTDLGLFGTTVTVTPLPAGAALLLPALAGLGVWARRNGAMAAGS